MIHELPPERYESVRPLFQGLWYHLNLFTVINGYCPGQIFADSARSPRTALIWEHVEGNCYIAGDHSDPNIHRALNNVICGTIYPKAMTLPDRLDFIVNYEPVSWEGCFDTVLADINPMKHWRKHFVIRQPSPIDWRTQIPDGFEMCLVDDDLLARDDLKNIEELRNWGSSSHETMKPLMGGGVGCSLLHGDTIASWCMGDYASDNAVEVGIHTDDDHKRQGLATLTAAAMVETCLTSGAGYVGWHCWSSNEASAATARKVGFTQTIEHPIYHAWHNPIDNWFAQGNMLNYQYKEYGQSAAAYENGFQLLAQDPQAAAESHFVANWLSWTHYHAGGVWARIGDTDAAFRHLHLAVENGFTDGAHLQNDDALQSLKENPQWSHLLAEVEEG